MGRSLFYSIFKLMELLSFIGDSSKEIIRNSGEIFSNENRYVVFGYFQMYRALCFCTFCKEFCNQLSNYIDLYTSRSNCGLSAIASPTACCFKAMPMPMDIASKCTSIFNVITSTSCEQGERERERVLEILGREPN